MSEWMTTGEMVDALKSGETAEGYIQKNGPVGLRVFADEVGHIRLDKSRNIFEMLRGFRDMKWRILPNYVSFEEAMEAHKNKKTVTFHHEEIEYKFEHSLEPEQFQALYYNSISLYELINGKWTIKDE